MANVQFYLSCAHGLEELLYAELKQFSEIDPDSIKMTHGGIWCQAPFSAAYEFCLNIRTAGRLLLQVGHADKVADRDELLTAAQQVDWQAWLTGEEAFVVRAYGTTHALRHTGFTAQVVKDGYLDYWRDKNRRPQVDKQQTEVTLVAQLGKNKVDFFIDLSGALHERGYRTAAGEAPIRETLAAAIAFRSLGVFTTGAGVSATDTELAMNHAEKLNLVADPFCGTGTLLIEAAMILTERAPGLLRPYWNFMALKAYQPALWETAREKAQARFEAGKAACKAKFIGSDLDARVLALADQAVHLLDLTDLFHFEKVDATSKAWLDLIQAHSNSVAQTGLILSNPPYGERLETPLSARVLYRELSENLYQLKALNPLHHWYAGILSPNDVLMKALRMRAWKKYKLKNGPLDIQLGVFDFEGQEAFGEFIKTDIKNRLQKNWQQRQRWAKKEGVETYRIYDADLPDYNAAIDFYKGHLVVQEYAAPPKIPDAVAESRLWDLMDALCAVVPVDTDAIYLKQRRRQEGKAQYTKKQEEPEEAVRFTVNEYNAQFWVNLTAYLDTGLFLDHRIVRHDIQKRARGKKVLNLFAYTGTASVHAALGGATKVTTVDLSRTYLNWAKDNFRLNHLTLRNHDFIQADCLAWLSEQAHEQNKQQTEKWDLIFLDPPTFSNSKSMKGVFDVERDYLDLFKQVKTILAPNGLFIFSTNKRRFKLDTKAVEALGFKATERTAFTTSDDFKQKPNHACWYIEHA